mmetsp:Transcript_35469/g.39535  ORF Transcript_35469/g.39535 Transcript_35469/m.39535 type:complete len:140 (-) Transcript_35469:195-614(-)|eukprot:CAMPEP_0170786586 /NCGR_PEP_ID=MMETSP0733-20121128/17732_1 /TAXON_ID=186038 /ORGANISM="Fragilariopsis kerguelensis, Strain L26-C5" /LENGTH=139 /DNA_ID=CAMNT_0011132543 /DNA_START=83 /DNA_END=502 /DNA_ORIENTATION=+
MSPLPYQDDTTENIALVHPSTVPVSSMWKKTGVALMIGTVFVAGNAWKNSPTADSAAAVSVSRIPFEGPIFDSCIDLSGKSKDQCTCIFDKCEEWVSVSTSSDIFRNCMGYDCTDYECFFDCAMGDDFARGCLVHFKCA